MLEERDARLLPKLVAEPERRVDRSGEHGRGHCLRCVVEPHELFGRGLYVNLKRSVRRKEHYVVRCHVHFVHAFYVDVYLAAAHVHHGVVQKQIARVWRDGRELQVRLAQGRKNSREQDFRARAARALANQTDDLIYLRMHAPEAVAREDAWREVGFDVEARDLRREAWVFDRVHDIGRDGRGVHVAVNEEHLLLRAYTPDARLEAPVFEHAFERAQVV